MTGPGASRRSRHEEDPRERILTAAGREFAERGYEAATVRDICAAAGVNIAAVNYYFGDKRRLYLMSVKHAHEQRVHQLPLPVWADDVPPATRLHDFVANLLERMLGDGRSPWHVRLMMREILQPTEACRTLVEDYMRPHFMVLVSILAEVTGRRLTEPEVRRVAMGVVGQCFIYRAAGGVVAMLVPQEELETLHTRAALADHVTSATLAALGAATPLTTVFRRQPAGSALLQPVDGGRS